MGPLASYNSLRKKTLGAGRENISTDTLLASMKYLGEGRNFKIGWGNAVRKKPPLSLEVNSKAGGGDGPWIG